MLAADAKEVETLRIRYLGKKGVVNDLMSEFHNVPADRKREVGMKLNELKTAVQEKINALRQEMLTHEDDHLDLDLTRTPYPVKL